MLKWFSRYEIPEKGERVVGPLNTEAEAEAVAVDAEENGCSIVTRSYQEEESHIRTWKPVAVAVVTRADGVYQIYSDDSEELLD